MLQIAEPTRTIDDRLKQLRETADDPLKLRRLMFMETILTPERREKIAAIQDRYMDLIKVDPPGGWLKYLDAVYWLQHSIAQAEELRLRAGGKTILDIGAGPGYFALVGSEMGNNVTALDIESPLLGEIASALDVTRSLHRIEANQGIPSFGKKFDLITAYNTMFNENWLESGADRPPGSSSSRYWSLEHWRFFIEDLMQNHLNYPGRIHISLNCEDHGGGVWRSNIELLDFFAENGADVLHEARRIDWSVSEPTTLKQPGACSACRESGHKTRRDNHLVFFSRTRTIGSHTENDSAGSKILSEMAPGDEVILQKFSKKITVTVEEVIGTGASTYVRFVEDVDSDIYDLDHAMWTIVEIIRPRQNGNEQFVSSTVSANADCLMQSPSVQTIEDDLLPARVAREYDNGGARSGARDNGTGSAAEVQTELMPRTPRRSKARDALYSTVLLLFIIIIVIIASAATGRMLQSN